MEPGDAKPESDFQLRRIGPPGSCPNVLDVMRIRIGVTSFGRGDGCNFYLDSKNLKNFISRKHAEIHTVKNEDDEYDFVLHHKGLNGTFVNDIKAPPTQLLAEGDKITFGHKNGYNLKPGQYASQPNSEFQYIFEKVKIAKKEVSRSPKKEVVSNDDDEEEDIKISSRNDLKDNKNVSKDQKSPNKQKTKTKNSPKKLEIEKTVQKSSNVEKVQNRKYLGTNNSAVSRNHASTSSSSSSSSSIVVPSSGDEDEEEEISPSHRGNKENDSFKFSPDKKDKSGLNRGETFNYGNSADKSANKSQKLNSSNKQETPTSTNNKVKINGTKRKLLSSNSNSRKSKSKDESASSSSSDSESSKDDEDEDDKSEKSDDKSEKSDDNDKSDDDAKSDDDDDDNSDSDDDKKLSIPDPYEFKTEKRTSNGKKISEMNKKTRSSLIGPPKRPLNIKSNKRKAPQKVTNTNTNKRGPKRQKRVTKSRKDDSDYEDEEEDLEDGVEWYEEEMCAASDCRKPKNKRVGWVQCDDCDNWYHTECVGCRYEHVKDTNIKFSCGCR